MPFGDIAKIVDLVARNGLGAGGSGFRRSPSSRRLRSAVTGIRTWPCEQRLENAIATRILGGEVRPEDTVVVGYAGKSFTFEVRRGQQRNGREEIVDAEVIG